MGGNINWVLILEDGTEYRMERWTNPLKWNTTNHDFLAGKPEAIQDSLRNWLVMKEDWERNRDTGRYENNMTDVYAPYPSPITGSEYGIVVTDFRTKEILSCNNYTSMDRTFFLTPRNGEEWYKDEDDYDYHEYLQTKWYYENGLIEKFFGWDKDTDERFEFTPVEGMTFDDFINQGNDRMMSFIRKLPFGWTIHEFRRNQHSGRQQAVDMIKYHFKLQLSEFEDKSLKIWAEPTEWDK